MSGPSVLPAGLSLMRLPILRCCQQPVMSICRHIISYHYDMNDMIVSVCSMRVLELDCICVSVRQLTRCGIVLGSPVLFRFEV